MSVAGKVLDIFKPFFVRLPDEPDQPRYSIACRWQEIEEWIRILACKDLDCRYLLYWFRNITPTSVMPHDLCLVHRFAGTDPEAQEPNDWATLDEDGNLVQGPPRYHLRGPGFSPRQEAVVKRFCEVGLLKEDYYFEPHCGPYYYQGLVEVTAIWKPTEGLANHLPDTWWEDDSFTARPYAYLLSAPCPLGRAGHFYLIIPEYEHCPEPKEVSLSLHCLQ